jgi:colicin import membrane protein
MRRAKMMVLLGIVGIAALGCDRKKENVNVDRATAVDDRAARAQKASEEALEQARKAQEEATDQQKDVKKAEKARLEKTEEVQKAEAELSRERREAQLAQLEAQQKSRQATETAQSAQNRAVSAQAEASRASAERTTESAGTGAAAGSTSAEGTVTQIDREHLVLDRSDGPDLHVKITPDVAVSGADKAGKSRHSMEDVSVGSSVRVKYHLESNQPVAERIELASGGERGIQ